MIELFCAFSQEPRLRRGKVADARNLRSNAYNAVCRYGAFAPRFFYALGSAVRRYGAFCTAFFLCPRFGSLPLWRVCTAFFLCPRFGSPPLWRVCTAFFLCPRFGSLPLWRVLPQSRVRVALLAINTLKAIRRAAREYARGKGRQSRGGGKTRQTDSATFHAFQTTVRRLPTELQSPTRWTRPLFLAMGAGVYPTETITLSAGTRVILPSAARTSA